MSRPVVSTYSALGSTTAEDEVTSWPMPSALGCFAPGITMMEIAQARIGNHSCPRRRPLFDWPAIRRVLGEAVVNSPIPLAYRTDFGVALKPPPAVTAFRYKAGAKRPGRPKAATKSARIRAVGQRGEHRPDDLPPDCQEVSGGQSPADSHGPRRRQRRPRRVVRHRKGRVPHLDLALPFAGNGRTDPKTLRRGSRDFLESDAVFALRIGCLAVDRIQGKDRGPLHLSAFFKLHRLCIWRLRLGKTKFAVWRDSTKQREVAASGTMQLLMKSPNAMIQFYGKVAGSHGFQGAKTDCLRTL